MGAALGRCVLQETSLRTFAWVKLFFCKAMDWASNQITVFSMAFSVAQGVSLHGEYEYSFGVVSFTIMLLHIQHKAPLYLYLLVKHVALFLLYISFFLCSKLKQRHSKLSLRLLLKKLFMYIQSNYIYISILYS